MTGLSLSGSEEHFSGNYADPSTCTYYWYDCVYCEQPFYLVDPDNNFEAGGATRTVQYRDKNTGEIKAAENRSEGVCLSCCKEIIRRQQ